MRNKHQNNDTILFITLGCAKNIVDSERLMRQVSANGLKVEFDEAKSRARIVIINTCGFIGDAKKESLDIIFEFVSKKQNGKIDKLYVMGCLSQRYREVLPKEIPEVDGFFGVNQINEILKSLGYKYRHELIGERVISTLSHYAYLKIAEGCNRKCSFCAIPLIRGKYESFPVKQLMSEAAFLAQKGVKELIIIAQDISSYGLDINNSLLLSHLVEKLSEIDGIEWIRLHYAYPKDFPVDLLSVIKNNPKVCKYIDIPIQHISDNMLKKMRRGINKDKIVRLIDKIRSAVPGITLRSTILTGHPGETSKDFEELVRFIEDTRFERLGTFKYSHEEGTYAANHYTDNVSYATKNKRINTIMSIQKDISMALNKKMIGKTERVIIDREEGSLFIGRTQFDSPDIDNEVIVTSDKHLSTGNFYNVNINEASEYDLSGSII
jgi:ribosomal protein S12 methylthiotransferase